MWFDIYEGFVMRIEVSQEIISCLKVIGDIVNDATFNFSEKGLNIYEMTKDGSNVVSFDWHFNCDLSDKFSIDMSKLARVLRIPKEIDSVFFSINKDEGDIKIEVRSEGFEREFFVKKLVIAEDSVKPEDIMKLNFTTKFTVDKMMFNRIIDEALMFNNFCFISTPEGDDKVTLVAEDEAGKGYKTDFDAVFKELKSSKAKYDLDNVKKIMKANTDTLDVSMGNNYPMKIFFNKDEFEFSFVIAPLIDE